jgi:hypothetical protein
MRLGFYGMPAAGKTSIMDRINFMEVISGSKLLRQHDPDFDQRDEAGRKKTRKAIANMMLEKRDFIMDGHYAFGREIAFTEEDGYLYDVFLYLFVDPQILKNRMSSSAKNRKYLKYDIEEWQNREISSLRLFCHKHNKDFYVIDNPPENCFNDVSCVIDFIRGIKFGYSCVAFARKCVSKILAKGIGNNVILLDGDKTLTIEDSSNRVFGYSTHLYDGNFYTGYQAWRQNVEFCQYSIPEIKEVPCHLNGKVLSQIGTNAYILTSGHEKIWRFISDYLHIPFFFGVQMSAEAKFFITKYLQEAGRTVTAFGDGMNDYYMMKQANVGYLVTKQDGTVSRSLKNQDLEGLIFV